MQARTIEEPRIGESPRTTEMIRDGQTVTLTKSAFASALESVLYPNPDDSGDPHNPFGLFGPGGPIVQK